LNEEQQEPYGIGEDEDIVKEWREDEPILLERLRFIEDFVLIDILRPYNNLEAIEGNRVQGVDSQHNEDPSHHKFSFELCRFERGTDSWLSPQPQKSCNQDPLEHK
jgi:hypothetical protein